MSKEPRPLHSDALSFRPVILRRRCQDDWIGGSGPSLMVAREIPLPREITIMSANPDSAERDPRAETTPAVAPGDPTPHVPQAVSAPSGLPALWVSVFGAALVAGFLAWGVGEKMHAFYRPSKGAFRGRYDFSALNREQAVADQKNAVIAFGTFGAVLASLLGAIGGLARRSVVAVSSVMLAGLLAGGLAGGLTAYGVAPLFGRFYSDADPVLLLPFLIRGGICAVIGMVVGLAFGLGKGGPTDALRSLTGGLLGGVLGIIAFEAVNAFFFPMDRNDNAIPTTILARFLCYLCVAVGVASGVVILGRDEPQPEMGATRLTATPS
jgi:hypothetical protein